MAADPFALLDGAGDDYTLAIIGAHGVCHAAGFLQMGAQMHVRGSVGAMLRIETGAGAVIEGDAHHGAGGAAHGGTIQGYVGRQSPAVWDALREAAKAVVAAVAGLHAAILPGAPASQCMTAAVAAVASRSGGALVLPAIRNADHGLSVYRIDGCLFLRQGETLLLEGAADDRFVVRVSGGLRLEPGSAIRLAGIPGSAALFALDGGGWAGDAWAQVGAADGADGAAELSGVYVSPNMFWQLGAGSRLPATRIVAGGMLANVLIVPPRDLTPPPSEYEFRGVCFYEVCQGRRLRATGPPSGNLCELRDIEEYAPSRGYGIGDVVVSAVALFPLPPSLSHFTEILSNVLYLFTTACQGGNIRLQRISVWPLVQQQRIRTRGQPFGLCLVSRW